MATRARASSSSRWINGSLAITLSPVWTRTWLTIPIIGAITLISPERGSTRPGATACQFLLSASAR